MAKPPRRSRVRRIRFACAQHLGGRLGVPGARLDEEAHHRAGGRDLEPLAADVADQHRHRAARQRPDAEHVAAADLVGDRLVDEAELEPGHRVRRAGHEAGGQRAGDPALVLELERMGDRAGGADAERGEPPQVVLAEAARQRVRRAQHAEQPAAERDRDVHERADVLRVDDPAHEALLVLGPRDVRQPGGGHAPDHALAEAEARAHEPLADTRCPRRAGARPGRGRSGSAARWWRRSAPPPARRSRGRRRRGRSRRPPPAERG